MKKIFHIIIAILRGFIVSPFWKHLQVIIVLVLSLVANGILWYIYQTRIRVNPVPFFFATGLVILNLILGNFLWNREKLASSLLIYTGLFIQILMLIFIKYLTIAF